MSATNPTVLDGIVGVDFSATSTTDRYVNGRGLYTDLGRLVWAKAGEAISEGQVCKLALSSSVVTATLLDSTISGTEQIIVGIAHKTIASGSYGWFYRGPFANVQVLLVTTIAADTTLTTTATAGSAGTGGDTILGLTSNASSGSGGLTYCRASTYLGTNI